MKDSYGYRPYRGSRVRRRGIIANTLLAVAIAAAALWVICLLLPLDEDGLRFPGQGDSSVADGASAAAEPDTEDDANDTGNADAPDGSASDAGIGDAPEGAGSDAENGVSPESAASGAEDGSAPEPTVTGDAPEGAGSDAENGVSPEPTASGAEDGSAPGEGRTPDADNSDPTGDAEPSADGSASLTGYVLPQFLRKNTAKAEPRWASLPEKPQNNRMVLLTAQAFVQGADKLISLYQNGTLSGAAVIVKDERGILYYPSAIPEVQGNQLILQPVSGFTETVARLREAGVRLTAVLYTHCDDRYPRRDENLALQNINGVGWRDGSMRIYLDPANAQANAYLTAVAAELEGLGFGELLLRGVGYPTSGWIARIAYPTDRFGVVTGFVTAVSQAVPTARVSVWLDTPAVADNPDNGQSVLGLYAAASRVFADAPDGAAAALQSQIASVAGDCDDLVVCVDNTAAAAGLPAYLLDVPLDALG